MSDDVAFRIQLGLILPKITSSIGDNLTEIVEELVGIVQAGTVEGEEVDLDAVKGVIMKDLEIFLDKSVFPALAEKLAPPADDTVEADAAEDEQPVDEAAE